MFSDINVSQGSVVTYARSAEIINNQFTLNLPRNLPVIFLHRLRFDRIIATSLWPHRFLAHPSSAIPQTNRVTRVTRSVCRNLVNCCTTIETRGKVLS